MPTEITQSNGRVAEVRVICDRCGKLIGTSFMKTSKAEAMTKKTILCQQCKEESKSAKNKPRF